MDVLKYARNPLVVEAVQVTDENVYEVAKWCGGDIISHKTTIPDAKTGIPIEQKRISLDTLRPLYKKHTEAAPGDWILKSDHGFKIYADMAFKKGFTEVISDLTEVKFFPTDAKLLEIVDHNLQNHPQ